PACGVPHECLHQVTREAEWDGERRQDASRPPALAVAAEKAGQRVTPEDQAEAEDGDGGSEDVKTESPRLPGVPEPRVRIRIRHQILHDAVDEPAQRDRGDREVVGPGFPALHRVGAFSWSSWWIARTRRAASIVARTVSVAPATGRIPRDRASSSSSFFP